MPVLKRCDKCKQKRNLQSLCGICGQNFACGSLSICCRCRERQWQGAGPDPPTRTIEKQPDPKAVAQRGGRDTAWAAAHSLTPDQIRKSQKEVYGLFKKYGPMTDTRLLEIAAQERIEQSDSGLRTRRSELVTLGLIVDSGSRDRLESGRLSILWRCKT